MRRRPKKNVIKTLYIDQLTSKGVMGKEVDPTTAIKQTDRWMVKGAAIGDILQARILRNNQAQILEITEPASDRIEPRCPYFLLCGGCQLQHTPIEKQREIKQAMLQRLFAPHNTPNDITIHPVIGGAEYGYRNKLELSFGTKRFYLEPPIKEESPLENDTITEEDTATNTEDSFLGMHPWNWYSKIVPLASCSLAHPSINAAMSIFADLSLAPAWNTYTHSGVWRHIVLRYGEGLVVNMITSSAAKRETLLEITTKLQTIPSLKGVIWTINDGIAEVATGKVQEILFGSGELHYTLCEKRLSIPHDGFAQVNVEGAEMLLQIVRNICPPTIELLLDLYCGSGAIGIALSDIATEIVGIEIQEQAIELAKQNAIQNSVVGSWKAGKVEEVIRQIPNIDKAFIIVDPPREGLHPKVAEFLSTQQGASLIYIACNPKSLARDKEILEQGHWKLTDVWSVDMFPQTPHVECVGKFIRQSTDSIL